VNGLSFVIFPKKGFVNVSGIPSFSYIRQSLVFVNLTFQTQLNVSDIIIDNSTAHGNLNFPRYFDLWNIFPAVRGNSDIQLTLQPHYFPGAVIRSTFPTCIVFHSGKFIIVGAKNRQQIAKSYRQLCAIIDTILKTQKKDQSCVKTVDKY